MASITNLITDLAQIDKALKYREKLLNTVNEAAEVLLTAKDTDIMNALMKGMEIVGRCVDADRVQIWRNEVHKGELHFVMRYEWLSRVGKAKKVVPNGLKFPYRSKPGWLEMFEKGENINSTISNLSPEDASFLGYYEMVSIVCLPLFQNKKLIGFFSVDDCKHERVYTDEEMKMFGSAGLMFASVFNRVQQNIALTAKSELIKAVNNATMRLLSTPVNAFSAALTNAMCEVATAVKADRVFIFRNLMIDDELCCTQAYEWCGDVESQQGKEIATDRPYSDAMPLEWYIKLERGEAIKGVIKEFPPEVHERFIPGDVKSLIVVPILMDNDFWGFIGFDDCRNEREFSIEEEEILRSCGVLFVNAMNRNKMLSDLANRAVVLEKAVVDVLAANSTTFETIKKSKNFNGKRILIADDVDVNRDILVAMLDNSGLAIDCVSNGKEAVEAVFDSGETYDLIFMDLYMPEMNGLEATRRIRKNFQRDVLPIVALTSYAVQDVLDDCFLAGMDDHLNKPIDPDKINAVLEKYMRK